MKIYLDPFTNLPTKDNLQSNSFNLTERSLNEIVEEIDRLGNCFVNIQIPSEQSQYDIVFIDDYKNQGIHQRGIKNYSIIIGIIGHSCFGFKCGKHKTTSEYYESKLGVNSKKLTILFNKLRSLKGENRVCF